MNASIEFNAKGKIFLLQCGNFSYACGINDSGYLVNLYWGGQIKRLKDLPDTREISCYRHGRSSIMELMRQEYPAWGGEFYDEPALKIDFQDGVRGSLLKYCGHKIEDKELIIDLKDTAYALNVKLHYLIREDVGILERWSEIVNNGNKTITLQSVMSANFNLPRIDQDYRLSHLSGRWGKECTIERQSIKQNKTVLESRTGLSGQYATPFFALDDGSASEHIGQVWFGALHWSGNWKMTVERNAYEQLSVCGGINDFDFSYPLQAEETFVTPVFSVGMSKEGFGGMSRSMHRYQQEHILPKELLCKPMPVIFNSWASMGINVNEKNILSVAGKAAEIGAELFVIDDGWQSALGDWTVDKEKFPDGLKPAVDKVKALGMDFGLWVEVESFEIKSKLYKEHPDWAMAYPGRDISVHRRDDVDRTSMLLNFAREDVVEYMYQALRKLFIETGIRYLKLDMNYYFSTPGWAEVPIEEQQTIWLKYVQNLHSIFSRLQEEFPKIMMENCAAGCGRADLAMSRYFSRINRSDNQDTLDILRLHEGFTWIHPSRLAGGACHISDAVYGINNRHIPIRFQAFAGMMGSLAVGKNLPACSQEELNEIRGFVEMHKRLRHIPHFGELYRLASHYEHPYAAFEYVSNDKKEAMLFVFGHSIQFGNKVPALLLKGLNPDAIYDVECFGNNPQEGYTASITKYNPMSGLGLMELGIRTELIGDYDARIIYLKSN